MQLFISLCPTKLFHNGKGKTVANTGICNSDVIHYFITADGSAKIAEGENEHCKDFNLAFKMSLAKYAITVNRLFRAKAKFKDIAAANKKLAAITGIHPDDG